MRKVIAGAFALACVMSLAAGIAGTAAPYVAMGCLLVGSVAASALDGVGGIPFLRAVRHRERQQMAAVYRTYIDFSELIPAFVFAFALLWLPIGIGVRHHGRRACRHRVGGVALSAALAVAIAASQLWAEMRS